MNSDSEIGMEMSNNGNGMGTATREWDGMGAHL